MSQTTRALVAAVRQARVGVGMPLAALGTSIATVLLGAALLGTSGYLISRAAERPPILALAVAMVLVRAFSVGRAIMRYLERLASHELALGALARLRAGFVARLIPLVPAGLPRLRAADLMSRFTADVDQLQELFLRGLLPPIAAVVVICLAGLAAALMLPVAGLVLVLVLIAFAIVVPVLTGAVARAAGRRQARARAELSSRVVDVLEGAPDIVAWGLRDAHIAGVTDANDTLMKLGRRDAYAGGIAAGLGGLGAQLAALAVLVVAVPAVRDGRLDGVVLAALVLMTLAVFEVLVPLPVAAQNLSACGQAAVRLEECVDRPVPIVDPAMPVAPGAGRSLVLQDASVRFEPDQPPVLQHIDLVLEWGRAVAIVGPSGSGKTTLCEVLARLRDLDSGQALLDGIALERLRQSDVRRAVTLVPQDAYLFPTSIAANLRIARPDATDDQLGVALARAGLGEWVGELPDGLETNVGQDGALLSGGQRQRLTLARGLLAPGGLLILDEPTSHLDAESEAAFLDDAHRAGVTDRTGLCVVTHRLAGMERFDEIVVIEAGRVRERGTHRELLAAAGWYASMVNATAV
jgi:ATP-binding cassette, subfamily C, bacterial CydC